MRVLVALSILSCLWVPPSVQAEQSQRTAARRPSAPRVERKPADIIKEVLPATVLIEGTTQDGNGKFGTGFVIDPSGIVVTNLHVVRGMTTARVRLSNGDAYDRVIVRAYDAEKDVALLQIPAFSLPIVKLGDSERVQQGALSKLGPDDNGALETHALVLVYRDAGWFGRALEPRVTLDDVELAAMDNKRYFGVWITPGVHSFEAGGGMTQSCQQPLTGEFQVGLVYSVRIDYYKTCFFARAVNPEVAEQDIKKLKPLNPSNIRHRAVKLPNTSNQTR